MRFLKFIGGKIGAGFLYGVGFSIAMFVMMAVSQSFFEQRIEDQIEEDSEQWSQDFERIQFDKDSGLELTVMSEKIGGEKFTLLGELTNSGEHSWRYVNIKAELYNSEDEFIDECQEYLSQTAKPGMKMNFKMSCGSQCSPAALAEYDHYKLMIVDAGHVN